ncbi:HIT domain-containing protein [Candidatus Woesearchaeota archaeon]|nr:HIT domain-containing protein [Candidatus Woesearchaeota archaeon]
MVTQEELEKMSPEEIAELQKQNCPFCKIVKGEIPSKKIYEDDEILAILDINPASKGHILILPKEHIPILPLVPPPVFKKLFVTTKTLAKAAKQVMLTSGVSIFIANGAVAGQQSPHFLFHIIPSDEASIPSFAIPINDALIAEQETIAASLQNNLTIMLRNHAQREGRQTKTNLPENQNADSSIAATSPEQVMAAKREHIAKMIEENPDVKDLLKNNPDEFKQTIKQNPQVEELFRGVDIDALSKNLNQIPTQTEQKARQAHPEKLAQLDQPDQGVQEESTESQNTQTLSSDTLPEVFLGQDPLAQREKVFAYFNKKPKAKELFMNDIIKFKELLSMREDIKPIFEDISLDKLAEKLRKAEIKNYSEDIESQKNPVEGERDE